MRRIAVLAAASARQADGIRDYAIRLVAQLNSMRECEAALFVRASPGRWRATEDSSVRQHPVAWEPAEADLVLLQYNPFWYGRRGFSPTLIRDVFRLRRARQGTLAIMVHETFLAMNDWRSALMGAWQRAQLTAIQQLVDVQFCSIEAWTRRLAKTSGTAPVHHLAVPSNFPDRREEREDGRRELGVSADTTVLTCFGLRHPGRIVDHVLAAAERVAADGREVVVLNLGTGETATQQLSPRVSIHSPGFLGEGDVARLLAASDVFVAPYEDGASTRRTTIMSALQHSVPVVATDGHLTDEILRSHRSALCLVPVADEAGFAEAVAALARDPERRRELAVNGRRLYETAFDWPVVVSRMLELSRVARR